MEPMRIAVTGSTGLIGTALVRSLRADGHEVVRLVRHPAREADEMTWDPERQSIDARALNGCDAVVHLAGAGIAGRRWSDAYKKRIRDSRLLGTATIADAIASLDTPPRVFVSGSAIGFYGYQGDRELDEGAPPGDGFLPSLCVEWEEAALAAEEAGVRTVLARTGLVVSAAGGAWGKLFPLFRAGLGGRLGDGHQYWSFISLHDEVAALRHLIDTDTLEGPVNLTAPHPVTNREVTTAMSQVLHRPALFPVPAPALRLVLGDLAADITGSQRVLPKRLLDSGFTFAFPTVAEAVRAAA
ncbi:TIGR01777 family oxidoreductase [Streptomyces paludis]|uniref:TIGR01777 family protein n=1 Tax=Streptomyces paludis TaxID=2282738 RepID=A0A345HL91_9ACTN|nr:TIGR01777 family oxidoreductase [Streptomyces paludis]AXG77465.1 TIGR01777 family protein [Streptomyces paludis]